MDACMTPGHGSHLIAPFHLMSPKAKEAAWEAERKKSQPDLNVKWIYAYVLVRSSNDRHKLLGVRLLKGAHASNGACKPLSCDGLCPPRHSTLAPSTMIIIELVAEKFNVEDSLYALAVAHYASGE